MDPNQKYKEYKQMKRKKIEKQIEVMNKHLEDGKGTFAIYHCEGFRVVKGYIARPFGFYKMDSGLWSLTHLPSGCLIKSMSTLWRAKKLAEFILGIACDAEWHNVRPFESAGLAERHTSPLFIRKTANDIELAGRTK